MVLSNIYKVYGVKATIRLRRNGGGITKANTCISFSHWGIYFMKDTYNVIHVIITEAFCLHSFKRYNSYTKQNTNKLYLI